MQRDGSCGCQQRCIAVHQNRHGQDCKLDHMYVDLERVPNKSSIHGDGNADEGLSNQTFEALEPERAAINAMHVNQCNACKP